LKSEVTCTFLAFAAWPPILPHPLQLGLSTNNTAETAGTVALAYAAHKALSPVRFPPTVALTPVRRGHPEGGQGRGCSVDRTLLGPYCVPHLSAPFSPDRRPVHWQKARRLPAASAVIRSPRSSELYVHACMHACMHRPPVPSESCARPLASLSLGVVPGGHGLCARAWPPRAGRSSGRDRPRPMISRADLDL